MDVLNISKINRKIKKKNSRTLSFGAIEKNYLNDQLAGRPPVGQVEEGAK